MDHMNTGNTSGARKENVTGSTAADLFARLQSVREVTEAVVRPLELEDLVIQSMRDVSPPKWHLGHTTWFFEAMVLQEFSEKYRPFFDLGPQLFNSYYESLGSRVARPSRGLLSRPTIREIMDYRAAVTTSVLELLERVQAGDDESAEILERVEIGIQHEQQHQELLYTDIKHILFQNLSKPRYAPQSDSGTGAFEAVQFSSFEGGLFEFGAGDGDFAFDNEKPRHKAYLADFELAHRLVTNSEYLAFIADGGYSDFRHWLADGWDLVQQRGWTAPLYWENHEGGWREFTLHGLESLNPNAPVVHVSFHEAMAYAHWAGCRLPSEYEWEHVAAASRISERDNLLGTGALHPLPGFGSTVQQIFGDAWEWTTSAYLPYPGFRPLPKALGEYNAKFMNDQHVLRGGSCVTPVDHIRPTYRNFFQGDKRWQFSGIRLAK